MRPTARPATRHDIEPTIDLLQTFAEIAAAFAGFAALVSLFRGPEWQEHERIFALANVVVISLASIGIAMLAASLLVHLSAPATWRICSAIFAIGWALGSVVGLRGYRRRTGTSLRSDSPLLFAGAALVSLLGIVLLAWNVLAPDAPRASLRFLLALELQLGVAGYLFIFAVFVPSSRDGGASPSGGEAL